MKHSLGSCRCINYTHFLTNVSQHSLLLIDSTKQTSLLMSFCKSFPLFCRVFLQNVSFVPYFYKTFTFSCLIVFPLRAVGVCEDCRKWGATMRCCVCLLNVLVLELWAHVGPATHSDTHQSTLLTRWQGFHVHVNLPLLPETSEGRYAGTRPHHNDGQRLVLG